MSRNSKHIQCAIAEHVLSCCTNIVLAEKINFTKQLINRNVTNGNLLLLSSYAANDTIAHLRAYCLFPSRTDLGKVREKESCQTYFYVSFKVRSKIRHNFSCSNILYI